MVNIENKQIVNKQNEFMKQKHLETEWHNVKSNFVSMYIWTRFMLQTNVVKLFFKWVLTYLKLITIIT